MFIYNKHIYRVTESGHCCNCDLHRTPACLKIDCKHGIVKELFISRLGHAIYGTFYEREILEGGK